MNKLLFVIPLLILNSPIKEKANRFSDILITPINQENIISWMSGETFVSGLNSYHIVS